ncbi:unnamed protein product, partial [Effrenium voratum]
GGLFPVAGLLASFQQRADAVAWCKRPLAKGKMGGGVSGGTRTQLAGTFLAEQTHYQPPKYTLVSVSSALGPDGCPRHVPSSAGTPSAGRLRPSGGPASVTVIPALADMEPLLQDNERRAKERIGEAASHPAEVERGVEEDERRRGRPGDREAQASEAFNRLCSGGQRPWVASRTEAELFAYLAQRGKDPSMAQLADDSLKAESSSFEMSGSRSKVKQKHASHSELFDSCLRQDQPRPQSMSSNRAVFWSSLPSSPKSPTKRRQASPKSRERVVDRLWGDHLRRKDRAEARMALAGVPWNQSKMDEISTMAPSSLQNSRFSELIEDLRVKDISVLPEDPVESFLQRSKRDDSPKFELAKKHSGRLEEAAKSRKLKVLVR